MFSLAENLGIVSKRCMETLSKITDWRGAQKCVCLCVWMMVDRKESTCRIIIPIRMLINSDNSDQKNCCGL